MITHTAILKKEAGKMKIATIVTVVFLSAIVLANPAWAGKDGNGKGHKPDHAAAGFKQENGNDEVFGFNSKEAEVITGVLNLLYGKEKNNLEIVRPSRKFCPPGLAKKNNGCMPPGLAKKYAIGSPLPDDVVFSELPKALREALGPPSKGKKYVQVDKDVLLITEGTKIVLDAIGLGRQ